MQKARGFTLVELLIVIVVIAILASISAVAYNGIQVRARDSQRATDIANITKALELYHTANGEFPRITNGSTTINSGWATTADASWQRLTDALAPYALGIGSDPVSTPGASVIGSTAGYNYAYFASHTNNSYCGTGAMQVYILVYRFEGRSQQNRLIGNCTGTQLGPYGASGSSSNHRVVK